MYDIPNNLLWVVFRIQVHCLGTTAWHRVFLHQTANSGTCFTFFGRSLQGLLFLRWFFRYSDLTTKCHFSLLKSELVRTRLVAPLYQLREIVLMEVFIFLCFMVLGVGAGLSVLTERRLPSACHHWEIEWICRSYKVCPFLHTMYTVYLTVEVWWFYMGQVQRTPTVWSAWPLVDPTV